MPSPIMLPPTPNLRPIRQELLRGLVRAIRMSKRHLPRHGPKNRGSRRWPAFVLRPFLVRASDEEVAARCFGPPLHWVVNNAKIKTQ
jgi:hypothetical protein